MHGRGKTQRGGNARTRSALGRPRRINRVYGPSYVRLFPASRFVSLCWIYRLAEYRAPCGHLGATGNGNRTYLGARIEYRIKRNLRTMCTFREQCLRFAFSYCSDVKPLLQFIEIMRNIYNDNLIIKFHYDILKVTVEELSITGQMNACLILTVQQIDSQLHVTADVRDARD